VQEGRVAKVVRAGQPGQAGVLLRPRLLHKNNRNPGASRGMEGAAKAANEVKVPNEVSAENEDRAESKALTPAIFLDSPRARIPREQARRNLKTTPKAA